MGLRLRNRLDMISGDGFNTMKKKNIDRKKILKNEASEMNFVDIASRGALFRNDVDENIIGPEFTPIDTPDVIQSERGTWLARWQSRDTTPPMEARKWVCVECWSLQNPPMAPMGMLFDTRIISVWERLKNVNYLRLRSEVACDRCGIVLNKSNEALVEVF